MANLQTAKTIEVMFDKVVERLEEQNQMAMMLDHYDMAGARTQNSSNVEWRPVEQETPIDTGWEFTDGDFNSLIEQSFPSTLGLPRNALLGIRADDFRDERFMDRWAQKAAQRLSAEQNNRIASHVANTGSLFYRDTTAGYDFIKRATTIQNERQHGIMMGHSMFINNRDAQRISSDIANRDNMMGMPEDQYKNGMMAYNIGGSKVFESAYLPTLSGGTLSGVTVSTTVSNKPEGFTTVADTQIPVDYRRSGDITLSASTNVNVGDYITFAGVNALGLQDKTDTGQLMTFKVVEKAVSGNTIQVYPKPIAADDAGLNDAELAYANINTQIASGAAVTRLNTDASARTNMFWADDSIEIVDGDIPFEMFSDLDGFEV